MFIIILFRLDTDPMGSVTGCDSSLGGGWMIFNYRLFKSILFSVN